MPSGKPRPKKVEDFLEGKTGFGKGGKRRDNHFREEVKGVCLVWFDKLRDWGIEVPDEKQALKKTFGMMYSLISWGIPKKPSEKIRNFRGYFTPPEKAIKLIQSLSDRRPRNPIAMLRDAFRTQPKYLP